MLQSPCSIKTNISEYWNLYKSWNINNLSGEQEENVEFFITIIVYQCWNRWVYYK